MKILKGLDQCSSYSTADHPDFANLRSMLHDNGFIQKNESSWNSDVVLKPFTLNGARFVKGDRFLCAPAIEFELEYRIKRSLKLVDK